MKDIAETTNSKTGVIITLCVGLTIGSVCTASIIALLTNTIELWLAYTLLGLMFLVSFFFILFWIFKRELFVKLVGVEPKDISVLLHDFVEDLTQKNINNLKDRAYEAAVVWSTFKARAILISLLVFLATSLFLMLNAYVMFRQNDLIMEQISLMEKEEGLIQNQVKISEQEKLISEFHMIEKIMDLVRIHNTVFTDIITTISKCGNIYDIDGGVHSFKQINNYLAFIEDLAVYEKEGFFKLEKINDLLGFYFLAFFRNNDGEIKNFIDGVRANISNQSYTDLLALMKKLESLPINKDLIGNIDRICKAKQSGEGSE
jgi:hypothetical protein